MENNIQTINNKLLSNARTIKENGEILYCSSDVTRVLGYLDSVVAVNTYCREPIERCVRTRRGFEMCSFVSEEDVYNLIVNSVLIGSEKIEKWSFSETLVPYLLEQTITNPDFTIGLLQNLKDKQKE